MENMFDPLEVAGNVYRRIMENDRVRVLNVTFQPGDKAPMHHHPDHVIYVLKGGKMRMRTGDKTSDMELKAGDAVFLEAQSHEAQNIGGSVVDLIVVELK
jgi:beta-alanine degradation protein BauB